MSITAFIGWLGTTESPLCSFYSSYRQQKINKSHVSDLVDQFTSFQTLKVYGTLYFYPSPKQLILESNWCHLLMLVTKKFWEWFTMSSKKCQFFISFYELRIAQIVRPSLHPQLKFLLQAKPSMNTPCLSVSSTQFLIMTPK